MTTPAKQYQNISYKELIACSENNPNRNRTLESIEIHAPKSANDTSLDKLGLKGYKAYNLNPSGILSLLVCIDDPSYYSLSTKAARTQQIIELATKLQEETETLKNSELSRKRRKIHDLIGASYNGAVLEEKDYVDLFQGITFLRNIQFVLMKEAVQESVEEGEKQFVRGEVVFSSDPTNWKRDKPIWIADFRARWVAVESEQNSQDIHKIISTWLSSVEQLGWIVKWPECDGTKTELVEKLSRFASWQETDKKLTKDVLSSRLGRITTIQLFTKWMSDSMNDTMNDTMNA